MAELIADMQRAFALDVVRRLRSAGFEAYWAGGCVRDQLLGRPAKDYDVATAATPQQIREVFRHRRTLALGAAFGVITVVGPRGAGHVEVTTFRRDAAYSDGRHPDSVTFSSAQEDASRRDFTINGLFFDPLEERVLDFVGGQEDLQRQVLRAIGNPFERFAEDKLRMLRAVRFAACFGFHLDADTAAAIARMASEISIVSAERIAQEMRRMLEEPGRVQAARMLVDVGLAAVILPEILPDDPSRRELFEQGLAVLGRLAGPRFPLALAVTLNHLTSAAGAEAVARRWRLSNKEIGRITWLVEHQDALDGAAARPWSELQPVMIAAGREDLVAWLAARAELGWAAADDLAWARAVLTRPLEELDPRPLITGSDLARQRIAAGPLYRQLLERARAAQLDGLAHTAAEALELVRRWVDETNQAPRSE